MLGYSVIFDGSEECVERVRRLSPMMGIEVSVTPKYLEEASLVELVEPLAGEAEVLSFRVLGNPGENVEKALIATDELGAKYLSISIDENGLEETARNMDEMFRLGAIYSKYIVLEPRGEYLNATASKLHDYIGGVFKLSIYPSPSYSTDDFTSLSLSYLGLLRIARLANFTPDGRPVRVTSRKGVINYFTVIKRLVQSGYEGLFIIDYEGFGLNLSLDVVKRDFSLLDQYLYSIIEKL